MRDAEGTIQFAYRLESAGGAPAGARLLGALLAWRSVLRRLQLLGQAPDRYDGFGYGNLSARATDATGEFIITASQTSGDDWLGADGLCRISSFDLERFRVTAQGARPPSSESLTHAMIYAADPAIAWVFHAHSPEIWRQARNLGLPATASGVAYGSPAMAAAVADLLATHRKRPLLFVTPGHLDGVFACGATADAAGKLLVEYLARSLANATDTTARQDS